MENVTEARGIVRRVEEPGRAGGDVLLVFRRNRSGRETFHCRVEPGGEFSPSLLDRFSDFVGYHVHLEPVSHRFSQRYEHYRGGHTFSLNFRVEVEVDDPEEVQLRLSRDPLGRLQRYVEEWVGAAVSRQEWEEIEADPTTAGARALASERRDHRGQIGPTVAEALDQRALEMGLRLLSVEADCELDELAKTGPLADADAEARIAERKAGHRVDVVDKETSAELARIELEAQGPVDRLKVERQQFLDVAARSETLAVGLLKSFNRALGGVAGQIDDVTSLTATVEEIVRLQRSISGLVQGSRVGTGTTAGTLDGTSTAAAQALPEANGLRPCAEFLSEAVTHVSSLHGDEVEKRGWLAYILRLAAAVLDEGTAGEELERLHEDFGPRFQASIRSLRSDEQRRFFDRLRQPEQLRSRLLGEEE